MIVSIPRDEWMQAVDLVKFTGPDHAAATGYVRVFTQEGQRYWMASDVITGLYFPGDSDSAEWALNIPVMAFNQTTRGQLSSDTKPYRA